MFVGKIIWNVSSLKPDLFVFQKISVPQYRSDHNMPLLYIFDYPAQPFVFITSFLSILTQTIVFPSSSMSSKWLSSISLIQISCWTSPPVTSESQRLCIHYSVKTLINSFRSQIISFESRTRDWYISQETPSLTIMFVDEICVRLTSG